MEEQKIIQDSLEYILEEKMGCKVEVVDIHRQNDKYLVQVDIKKKGRMVRFHRPISVWALNY
jgi:ribosome maturation factor RimP